MWQQVAVLVVVIASAAYATCSLLPAAVRWRLNHRVALVLQRSPGPAGRLARRLAREPAPAGGSCQACPASSLRQARKSPG